MRLKRVIQESLHSLTGQRDIFEIISGDPDIIFLGLVLEFNDFTSRKHLDLLLALLTNEMLDLECIATLKHNSDGWEMLIAHLHVIAIAL